MQIAVIGSTRGVGREIVERAMDVGYSVAALARKPQRMGPRRDRLTVVPGDVLDRRSVRSVLRGTEAVFVCLSRTHGNPSDVVSRGTANVIFTMQELGIRRLIVLSAFGVGDSREAAGLFSRARMVTTARRSFKEREEQERLVRKSKLDWTIIRSAALKDSPASGVYTVDPDPDHRPRKVSRKDVADFALRQLATRDFLRRTPLIC